MSSPIDVELAFLMQLPGHKLVPLAKLASFDPFVLEKRHSLLSLTSADGLHEEIEARREDLIMHLLFITTHWVARRLRDAPDYRTVLRDVAAFAKVETPRGITAAEMEAAIIEVVLQRIRENATQHEWKALLEALDRTGREGGSAKPLVAGAGALALGNLAGFSLYTGAATVVGAVSGALGVTLPFAVYTTMSSALAVVLGPVGWSALGAAAVYKLGQPKMRMALATVAEIARLRLEAGGEVGVAGQPA